MILFFLACIPDDVKDTSSLESQASDDSQPTSGDDSQPNAQQSIVGDWLSEGDHVAPLLQAYGISRVEAHFKMDLTYQTDASDTGGHSYSLGGTYSVDTSTLPGTIVVTQTTPQSLVAEGIWEVDGNTLRYEVAQTSPDQGFVPPTPEGGFGSTGGPNVDPNVNIQIYVKM